MIPPKEVEDLANLYDRFANTLDPFSDDRDRAEENFYKKLTFLHCAHAYNTDFPEFRREAVRQCKLYLKKN